MRKNRLEITIAEKWPESLISPDSFRPDASRDENSGADPPSGQRRAVAVILLKKGIVPRFVRGIRRATSLCKSLGTRVEF